MRHAAPGCPSRATLAFSGSRGSLPDIEGGMPPPCEHEFFIDSSDGGLECSPDSYTPSGRKSAPRGARPGAGAQCGATSETSVCSAATRQRRSSSETWPPSVGVASRSTGPYRVGASGRLCVPMHARRREGGRLSYPYPMPRRRLAWLPERQDRQEQPAHAGRERYRSL